MVLAAGVGMLFALQPSCPAVTLLVIIASLSAHGVFDPCVIVCLVGCWRDVLVSIEAWRGRSPCTLPLCMPRHVCSAYHCVLGITWLVCVSKRVCY
jgi:hypothetical protein